MLDSTPRSTFTVNRHSVAGAMLGSPDPLYVAPGRDEDPTTARVWTLHTPAADERRLLELAQAAMLDVDFQPPAWGVLGGDDWASWAEVAPRADGELVGPLALHLYFPAADEDAARSIAVSWRQWLGLDEVLFSPALDWSYSKALRPVEPRGNLR